MAKVTLRTFLKADKYKELIEKYNDVLHTEKQIIYIFNDNNFRFMKTKRYCSLDSSENYVKIESKYSKSMENILKSIGYEPSVKWYRTRSKAKLDYDILINLDYVVGYGYLIELSKDIDENVEHDLIKIELGNFLESLDIEILEDKKMKEKYDEYVLNWDRLTYKVSEESFFK